MELFFRKEGHPALPPLILLHGLWGASDNWLPVARLLSEHFFVLLPDCRNHGHSPHAPENNYPALVKDLEEFIDQLHLPVKPFLAGHSMGGKVIMHLLLRSPRIAAKAAILDICPKTYPSMEEHCRLATFMTRFPLSHYHRREEIHRHIRQCLGNEKECQILFKNLYKTVSGFKWKTNTEVLQKYLPELASWLPPAGQPSYPGPILFVKGEVSPYIQPQDDKIILSYFPQARFSTRASASHWLHTDQPMLLSQTLSRFFLEEP